MTESVGWFQQPRLFRSKHRVWYYNSYLFNYALLYVNVIWILKMAA
jgi:hypothetical protein